MKKIMLFFLVLLFACVANSQTPVTYYTPVATPLKWDNGVFDKSMAIPTIGMPGVTNRTGLRKASFVYDTICHCAKIYKPELGSWDSLSTAGSSGSSNTEEVDTTITFDGSFASFTFGTGKSYDPTAIVIAPDKIDGQGFYQSYDATTKRITISYGVPPIPASPATTITIIYKAILTKPAS